MDDMRLLAEYFVQKYRRELRKPDLKISSDALKLLMKLPWEGNIRELENTIERAAILCSNDIIEADDVHPDTPYPEDASPLGAEFDLRLMFPENAGLNDVLYAIEKKMLTQALVDTDYVQARAAEKLGITKSLLQYKMKKYRIKKRR
jgi:two-component system NtrC family response regulator